MEKVPVGVSYLRSAPNPWEGPERFAAINVGEVHSHDDESVVGDPIPVHVERQAKLV